MGKNKRLKKMIIIGLPALLVAVVLIVVTLATTVFKPVPVLVNMGEPIQLSQEQDMQTVGPFFTYSAGLTWKSGTLRITVEKATLYPNLASSGISATELAHYSEEQLQQPFLLLEITAENVDAQFFSPHMYFNTGSLVPAEAFSGWNVLRAEDFPNIAPRYFSDHQPQDDERKDYWAGTLEAGESKTYQVGYFLPDTSQSYILRYGSNGLCSKYGTRLEY